jgi:cation diffusion facilitator CzcD-associated flavoprotein CzcO
MSTYLPGNQPDPLLEPVCIVGSGIAGLITAHILLQDGFKAVEVLTRDRSVGGVWSEERVYPGLQINRSILLHNTLISHR